MAKTLRQLKCQKKKDQKPRFRKKIRFIRSSKHQTKSNCSEKQTNINSSLNSSKLNISFLSENSETDYCLNLSLINWSHNFLQENTIPIKHNEFYKVLKKLCLKENEFVFWIMYIELYIKEKKDIDIETLLYIGLFVKKLLDIKSNDNNDQKIKKEKMNEIEKVFEGKIFSPSEFNEKYNHFCKYTQNSKHIYYNINLMVNFIYDENLSSKKIKKTPKIEDNKENEKIDKKIEEQNEKPEIEETKKAENLIEEKQNDDAENNITHNIDNQSYIIDPIDIENDGMKKEPNEDENWSEGFEREHFPGLPVHSEFMKLDSSVENLDNNLKGLFYFLKN